MWELSLWYGGAIFEKHRWGVGGQLLLAMTESKEVVIFPEPVAELPQDGDGAIECEWSTGEIVGKSTN